MATEEQYVRRWLVAIGVAVGLVVAGQVWNLFEEVMRQN